MDGALSLCRPRWRCLTPCDLVNTLGEDPDIDRYVTVHPHKFDDINEFPIISPPC